MLITYIVNAIFQITRASTHKHVTINTNLYIIIVNIIIKNIIDEHFKIKVYYSKYGLISYRDTALI